METWRSNSLKLLQKLLEPWKGKQEAHNPGLAFKEEKKQFTPSPSLEESPEKVAERLGIEIYPSLEGLSLPKEFYKKAPYAFVKKHIVLPIAQEGNEIIVAVADPLHVEACEELRHMLGCEIRVVYAAANIIFKHIDECYEKEQGAASALMAHLTDRSEEGKGEGEVDVYDLLDESGEHAPIIRLLNLILIEAIQQGASDIHFEPYDDNLRIRYRIDGVLQSRHSSTVEYQSQLLTRIKVMAKMDIAERRLPQDGRIKLRMGNREVDFRVSTVPISNGERIVMRILDKGNVLLGFDNLGMLPEMLKQFKKLISLPEGIVLVTGPTGSGKTTTLYSAVSELQGSHCNIMTIEDPVEYKLQGIAQIGVRPKIGLSFATGLRHILRQDPDIIMVGEIRDVETAEIAIQASLTGHLVMSTLHTNDAPSAITRLVDMGIEPYLLSSSLVGVLAQRLVRRICPHCCTAYQPVAEELLDIGLSRDVLPKGLLYKGAGCDRCFGSGYRGRHGIYELMTIDYKIQQQIVKSANAIDLRNIALERGMIGLRQHGAELVKAGVTTVAEVLRVTRGVAIEDKR